MNLDRFSLRPVDVLEDIDIFNAKSLGYISSKKEFLATILPLREHYKHLCGFPSTNYSNIFDAQVFVREYTSRNIDTIYRNPTDDLLRINNTLELIIHEYRQAIYVLIINDYLYLFCPICNINFENNWNLSKPSNYEAIKESWGYRDVTDRNYISDINHWWKNQGILCNIQSYGSLQYLSYRTMMIDSLRLLRNQNRGKITIPWCEFFLNVRDRPILCKEFMGSYMPVLSPYVGQDVLDIPIPLACDYEASINEPMRWSDRWSVAVWRGSATGAGITIETNPRLKIASLEYEHLDAKLTSWDCRDKLWNGVIQCIHSTDFSFIASKDFYLTTKQQCRYKYIIYIEGHCAASRMASLLSMRSLILWVKTNNVIPDMIWYFPLLKENEHYISVESDLSNLKEKIDWCIDHDAECQRMAHNAQLFYDQHCVPTTLLHVLNESFISICDKQFKRNSAV